MHQWFPTTHSVDIVTFDEMEPGVGPELSELTVRRSELTVRRSELTVRRSELTAWAAICSWRPDRGRCWFPLANPSFKEIQRLSS